MPRPIRDLTGQTFGHLTVIIEAGREPSGCVLWLTECDCGKRKVIRSRNLLHGNKTTSCGCRQGERNDLKRIKERIRNESNGENEHSQEETTEGNLSS